MTDKRRPSNNLVMEINPKDLKSKVLQRIVREVQDERKGNHPAHLYDRVHTRHNRS